MFDRSRTLDQADPDIWAAIQQENTRQEQHIELIASENYASPAVMQAQGTQLTNKYAEGYPGKRYYGGCEYVDVVEQLAIDRLKAIFGAEAANVQPNSGSQANQGVYMAVLKPGDTVLGMSLAEGGHLTHGSPVNASGKLYNFHSYGLDANEVLDYDKLEELARTHKPKLIVGGASAYALRIDVDEELQRLKAHLDEIGRLLKKGGEVGKRLDFLIQELHREANTLGSKAAALELTQISVEMKVLIEQMREQVQNIE